ncbi:MAG: hypothetical protein GEU86_17610 [Actinophytocola sp.]|nr:hypothetical protein [Actinophytocola sp.]
MFEGQVVAHSEAGSDDLGYRYTDPLEDAPVALYARPVGWSTWKRVATGRTNSETVFRFASHKPSRNTDYKVVYPGELIYAASSVTKRVGVRRVISSSMTSNGDGTYTMRGSVAPKVSGKTVRLQRKTCSSCAWSTVKSTKTSSSSTWAFRVTAPTSGSRRYRVYTPADSRFLTSYSGVWTLRR